MCLWIGSVAGYRERLFATIVQNYRVELGRGRVYMDMRNVCFLCHLEGARWPPSPVDMGASLGSRKLRVGLVLALVPGVGSSPLSQCAVVLDHQCNH